MSQLPETEFRVVFLAKLQRKRLERRRQALEQELERIRAELSEIDTQIQQGLGALERAVEAEAERMVPLGGR